MEKILENWIKVSHENYSSKRLTNYESGKNEAKEIITNIAEGKYNNSQITSFLTVFMMRNISLEELEGFREALLELCISVDLSEFNTIDLCGTGGDGKDTFNISTLSSFVTAGAEPRLQNTEITGFPQDAVLVMSSRP